MRERVVREAAGVGLLLFAALLLVALASHSPLDPSPLHLSSLREEPLNLGGWLGATLSAALFGLFGLAAFLLPPLAAVAGWRHLGGEPRPIGRATVLGWMLVLVTVPGFATFLGPGVRFREGIVSFGGWIGRAGTELLSALAGPVGAVLVLIFTLVLGLLLVSRVSLAAIGGGAMGGLRTRLQARRSERERRQAVAVRARRQQRVVERQGGAFEEPAIAASAAVTVKELPGKGSFRIVRRVVEDPGEEPLAESGGAPSASQPATTAPPPAPARAPRPARSAAAKPVLQEEFDFVDDLAAYDLPKISFLEEAEETAEERDSSALLEIARLVTAKCQEFRVGGEVVNIRTGPVITTYEFRLDSGVKISSVQNLAEDLALALRTESVRIERIPGRATVGIEVPNPQPQTIRLRQLLESSEFQRSPSHLQLALGVDIHGKPFYADLQRMPHLLIGGFTGAGKSVGVNAMIMSILYKARPDEVKFIMVDPKMVELGVYGDIPHLLTPIITDPKKAANALGWAVAEMEDRYRRLAAGGVRNLAQYNNLVSDPAQLKRLRQLAANGDGPVPEPLPYIVIIIDELADLMISSGRAVEESITRLAQKARAVGVHLICATQRPSVDILTGIIKANFPCRIAYKVRSKFDSRTILDGVGAEHLLGRGDMLLLPPGTSTLKRLHGALVTEKEIATVVRYAKRFGKPEYLREVLSHPALGDDRKGGRGGADDETELDDPMYEQAARLVVETRQASASFVQRRLRLGYTRAARLIDMMQADGLIGPLEGTKREVLVPKDHFEEVDATRGPEADDDQEEG